ncbi:MULTISPECIES: hypothetical protein [unclassified Paraflavitalea]|uniref:hypothetical protein n=1 Tax=unclassified Paraflavitalea TaxID=2798305 RepID=UPI003D3274E5
MKLLNPNGFFQQYSPATKKRRLKFGEIGKLLLKHRMNAYNKKIFNKKPLRIAKRFSLFSKA